MDRILQALSLQVTGARDLESLTRPLLEMLETVTGLESTYLTEIDLGHDTQHIRFARNVATLQIPEGGSVQWGDALCRRALDEGRFYTEDVASCWGFPGGAGPGIRTYLSCPVQTPSGSLYGTLCAASAEQKPLTAGSDHLIAFFARLIAEQVEREQLLQQLQQANHELSRQALSDPLTGLPNRRALMHELNRLFSLAGGSSIRCCSASSISTASRPSMTPTVTTPATCCCSGWPQRCQPCCAAAICWRGWGR